MTHAPASAPYNSSFSVAAAASSGLTVAVTTTGGCSVAGGTVTMTSGTTSCVVHYNQAGDSTYAAATEVTETVTASKATPTATLTVTNSPVTYDGSTHSATIATTSASVAGSITNVSTGGAASQTSAGSYSVTADFVPTDTTDYNSLTGLSAGNFIINKATPTLQVTNSPVVANGNPQAAIVTGSVSGGPATNILYNASSTEPSDPGTYAVTADFAPTDSTNYNSLSGASAGNFVINAAPVDVSSVDAIRDIHVVTGTTLGSVALPTTAGVTYSDASSGSLAVMWDGGTPAYDGSTNGTYVFNGTLTLAGGVTNTGSLKAQINVIVAALPTYMLTYSAGSNGSVTGTTTQSVSQGSDGSAVTAVADSGFSFVNWSDGSTANPRTDTTVTSDVTVTANFTPVVFGGGAGGSSFTPASPVGQVLGVSTTTIATTTAATSTMPVPEVKTEESTTTPAVSGEVLGASTFVFNNNLHYRMKHADVAELQKALIAAGYSIPDSLTNYFGPQTLAAVKAFQKAHNLPVTGLVGALTRALLNATSTVSSQ